MVEEAKIFSSNDSDFERRDSSFVGQKTLPQDQAVVITNQGKPEVVPQPTNGIERVGTIVSVDEKLEDKDFSYTMDNS